MKYPLLLAVSLCIGLAAPVRAANRNPEIQRSVTRSLDYLARQQRRQGYWEAPAGSNETPRQLRRESPFWQKARPQPGANMR